MGIFKSPQEKWIKKHSSDGWNRMFTGFGEDDVMVTKLMVYESVSYADRLLDTNMFACNNIALRVETIILAKMHFYHLVTKSATVHNLFYGYIHELFTNHYHEDLETTHFALEKMHALEKWYLTRYYDYYNNQNGSFAPVIKEYCKRISGSKAANGESVLVASADDLHQNAAMLLMEMHNSFIAKVK